MKLDLIHSGQLSVSKANMRDGKKPPEIGDILPSIRKRGILVPLLVRAAQEPDRFEIVAGRRRFHAALAVADETGEAAEAAPLPCAILEGGDDADAIEASLIENVARRDPDEVTQWESFTRLVKEGRGIEDISATFGIPELGVKRILALGNLLPRIRDLYRREEIDAGTVRHLTLATKAQQKEWLTLFDSPDAYAPTGHQLKSWLFGGAPIATGVALFGLATYEGEIVADLFGEGGYFASAEQFWEAQNAAIDARKADYLEQGWSEVIVLPPTEHFHVWEYEKTSLRKGGKVYISVSARGEVAFHEGYLSRKEAVKARRAGDGEAVEKPQRPEITGPMQTYLDLHRHAAVRCALAREPKVALRLMVAHAIGGSHLWSVRVEPQNAHSDAIAESVETSASEAAFDARRRAMLDVLGLSPDESTVTGSRGGMDGVSGLFVRLLTLSDKTVLEIAAVVMAETLAAGTEVVEAVGLHLGVDMSEAWQPDDAFFELLRDREVLTSLLAEIGGEDVAKANAGEKAKSIKAIIRDHLSGENGRPKVEKWVPRWMAFPPSAYTERGGVGTVRCHARIATLFEPQPEIEQPETAEPVAQAA